MQKALYMFMAVLRGLIIYCAFGCLCGAGVGLFLFLRLGFPNQPQVAGYLSGLFVISGIKFGFALWAIRGLLVILRKLWVDAGSCGSSYQYRNMDLNAPGRSNADNTNHVLAARGHLGVVSSLK